MQCASPDAIARLPATKLKHDADELWTEYFRNQKHGSLKDYLVHCLGNNKDPESDGSLVQVSFQTLNKIMYIRSFLNRVNACWLYRVYIKTRRPFQIQIIHPIVLI